MDTHLFGFSQKCEITKKVNTKLFTGGDKKIHDNVTGNKRDYFQKII